MLYYFVVNILNMYEICVCMYVNKGDNSENWGIGVFWVFLKEFFIYMYFIWYLYMICWWGM